MILRFTIFMMLALGLAGFGAAMWISTHQTTPAQVASVPDVAAPPPEPVLTSVLTAARPLRIGTLIHPEDLAATQVAVASITADTVAATAENRAALAGSMLRRSYEQGETLLSPSMIRPGDRGFLALVLAPGTRSSAPAA